MKLRNKRTGDIIIKHIAITVDNEYRKTYSSLAELNEDWEDYKPKEPLIKDEKIRKAVRAWANANDIGKESCYGKDVEFDRVEHRLKWVETSIEFNSIKGLEELRNGRRYTIAELCGEEEE